MKQPRKHAELIKQWADGAKIQVFRERLNKWEDTDTPIWLEKVQYRVKPEYTYLYLALCDEEDCHLATRHKTQYDNVRATFDLDGKLINLEII